MTHAASPSTPIVHPADLAADGQGATSATTPDQKALGELLASWHSTAAAHRRKSHRSPCNRPARLIPLDPDAVVLPEGSFRVVVKDCSHDGISLAHTEPLPFRKALVEFEPL